jgi:hypothetical protein
MNLDDLASRRRIALREVNDGYGALKDGSLNRIVVTSEDSVVRAAEVVRVRLPGFVPVVLPRPPADAAKPRDTVNEL